MTSSYGTTLSSGKCLEIADSRKDNGAPAQQWTCVPGAATQLWGFFNDGRIVNKNSGKVLEIDNGSTRNGARAQQWTFGGAQQQLWTYGEGARAALRASHS
ncbi:RICIN domain-containing protein [Streptomyces ehimensis]|uniref:RICIN domain-containing protein n=1 Tax=Streptomyces ehimensis TaxID=68195 RepID=A0ABV9BWI4_9ACTN